MMGFRRAHESSVRKTGAIQAGIGRVPLLALLLFLLVGFFGLAAAFGIVYHRAGLLQPRTTSWLTAWFYAVGVQVTNQFTQYRLVHSTTASAVAASESFVSLVFFAIFSSIVIVKLMQPPTDTIVFSKFAVFYPVRSVLRVRYMNTYRAALHRTNVRMSIRSWIPEDSDGRWVNPDLALGLERGREQTHLRMQSMVPWFERTAATDSAEHGLDDLDRLPLVDFHPAYANEKTSVAISVVAVVDDLKSDAVSYHRYENVDIVCGRFALVDPEGTGDWKRMNRSNWHRFHGPDPGACASCRFGITCRLSNRHRPAHPRALLPAPLPLPAPSPATV